MELSGVAELLKAVAWPAVALTVFLVLRSEARSFMSMLTLKVDRASRTKLLKGMIDLVDEVAKASVSSDRSGGPPSGQDPAQEFEALAKEYDALDDPDYKSRVATRRRQADRLGELAASLKLPRAALAESTSEGKLVALATAAVLKPMTNDFAALEKAAETANFNFTRYRLALAIVPTLSKAAVSAKLLRRAAKILDSIEHRPNAETDASLQRRIDGLRAMVASLG